MATKNDTIRDEKLTLVLVLEPDPFYRHYITNFFQKAPVELDFVQDGLTVLKRVKMRKPNLLIMDIFMPRVDGLSLCQHIRSEVKETPIIVFSAVDVEKEALQAGATLFLSKPFHRERFAESVGKLLSISL